MILACRCISKSISKLFHGQRLSQIIPHLLNSRRFSQTLINMANSRFEYVKSFETEDRLDPQHWIVIALKCSNFQSIVEEHSLERPNDKRMIYLMEDSTKCVMAEFKELQLSYCFSDQCTLVFPKNTTLYRRRGPKLLTNLCSLMASSFVSKWSLHFDVPLTVIPIMEGTIYLLPSDQGLRDFMTQGQLSCHYRNLHETVLWSLVKVLGISFSEACDIVKGTSEGEKNELLFSRCNMNYNKEEDMFKKGFIVVRKPVPTQVATPDGTLRVRNQSCLVVLYTDFTKDNFWKEILCVDQDVKLNAKTNYLKDLEKNTKLLPHAWVVVRIDGKGFHKFSEKHNFTKPNDLRSIELMNQAAHQVMVEYCDIVISYGQSDEYTFVIDRYSRMMDRNANKIMSAIVSLFAATYVHNWSKHFENVLLEYSPAFDARVVLYPNNSCLRDCLSWRQADCHINNMYNLCFWTLVQNGGLSRREAEERLSGTFSKDKRALLFTEFNCDYDQEDAIYRKGTILYRESMTENSIHQSSDSDKEREIHSNWVDKNGKRIVTTHVDMINDKFWEERPWILGSERCARTLDTLDD